jgi:hypothetical protein|tara:strand:- start:1249 stop:1689 length:441 start_codon:yes stop_codon:yes gene_type:complete
LKVAILYQSLRGGTEKLAEALGTNFQSKGSAVGVYPITNYDAQFVLNSDLIVVGTWTDGLFGLGSRPGQLSKLNTLRDIAHKDVALFVTYEISPEKSLTGLNEWANGRSANIVASAGFKVRGPFKKDIQDDIDLFVENSLQLITLD